MKKMINRILFLFAFLIITCSASPNTQIYFNTNNDNNKLLTSKMVTNIAQCPKLKPRKVPPKSVHDLRVDDIKIIMALGDSVTAGFGAKGRNVHIPIDIYNLYENRGVSFSMGGDPGAVTIANFIQHYSPELIGSSIGNHLVELCYGD